MHRLPDDYNPDDMDGADFAAQSDPDSYLSHQQGEDSPEDVTLLPGSASGYTPDWPQLTRERKIAAGYRCSKCSLLVLERWEYLLHTHHMNGDKSDNHLGNLMVVCVDCHDKLHRFVSSPVPTKDRLYLDSLRQQQGLPVAW